MVFAHSVQCAFFHRGSVSELTWCKLGQTGGAPVVGKSAGETGTSTSWNDLSVLERMQDGLG